MAKVYDDEKAKSDSDSFDDIRRREFSPDEESRMDESARQGAADDEALRGLEKSHDGPDATESGSSKLAGKKGSSDNSSGDTAGGGEGGSQTSSAADSSSNQDESEAGSSSPSKKGRFRAWAKKHKKGVLISGAASLLISGGGFFAGMPVIYGAQLLHDSNILQRPFAKNESDSAHGIKRLFRYYRASRNGTMSETRVGLLSSVYMGKTLTDLEKIGITFEYNANGSMSKTLLDTDKLKAKFPEMEGMDKVAQQDFLREKFGLTGDAGYNLFNTGENKFAIDAKYMDFNATKALAERSIGLLGDGKVATWMKTRVAGKYFNLPSLFHPWKKLEAKITNRINDRISISQEQKQTEEDRLKAAQAITDAPAEEAVKEVTDKTSGVKGTLTKALTITGLACIVYDIAGKVVTINHDRIVVASEVHALDVVAGAAQMQSGQDMQSWQPAAMTQNLVDASGKGISGGAAMISLSHDGTARGGVPMPEEYKQAYSSDSTAAAIKDGVNIALGGSAPVLCSTAGMIGQAVGMLALSFGDVASGGALTPGLVGVWAAKEGTTFALSGVIMHYVEGFILNKATLAKLGAKAFRGPVGGDLLAFGARAAANTVGIAGGGIALGNTASTLFADQMDQQDQQQFAQKNAFARVFDINDRLSLTGRMADAISPNMLQNATNFASSLPNIGKMLGSVFSMFMPKAQAAVAYNWGFSQFGIPDSILNDPQLQDPYANAAEVVNLLNADPTSLPKRASDCFGVDVAKDPKGVWDINQRSDVNTADEAYTNAHCADLSDRGWKRMIMFVFDTTNMKAVACYQGDETSCNDVAGKHGGTSTGAPSASGASIPTGDTQSLAKQILASPNITFQTTPERGYMQHIADTGHATECGAPAVDPRLLADLLAIGQKYKLVIGVIDDGHNSGPNGTIVCDSGFHPKGMAADINGVNRLDDSAGGTGNQIGTQPTSSKFLPEEMGILREFYGVAGGIMAANGGGNIGQIGCFDTPPAAVTGVVFFHDTCSHVHLDVGPAGADGH